MKIVRFLKQNPDYQIHLAGRWAAQSLNRDLAAFDLNMTQALILAALYFENDHTARFEDLAAAFELTKGGLSQHLAILEGKKLVTRPRQQEDRRSFLIILRAEAQPLCLNLVKIFDGHQRKVEAQFGESALKDFLEALRTFTGLK